MDVTTNMRNFVHSITIDFNSECTMSAHICVRGGGNLRGAAAMHLRIGKAHCFHGYYIKFSILLDTDITYAALHIYVLYVI